MPPADAELKLVIGSAGASPSRDAPAREARERPGVVPICSHSALGLHSGTEAIGPHVGNHANGLDPAIRGVSRCAISKHGGG